MWTGIRSAKIFCLNKPGVLMQVILNLKLFLLSVINNGAQKIDPVITKGRIKDSICFYFEFNPVDRYVQWLDITGRREYGDHWNAAYMFSIKNGIR